jgi:hypothetical protein
MMQYLNSQELQAGFQRVVFEMLGRFSARASNPQSDRSRPDPKSPTLTPNT